jgi:beta-glucosidase
MTPEEFVDVQGTHAELIREIGAASVVLLKNENHILPFQGVKTMAIIGDDAGPNTA